MNRTYQKNIRRTLASTRSRFLAIFSIVALGVGFLAGLVSTTPDMRDSVERYLDDANLYDLRVIGTLGLTDADVQALEQLDGVQDARGAWLADVLVKTPESDQAVARVHSLPTDADGNPEGTSVINRLVLEQGRWPQASGECVVEAGAGDLARGLNIGDTIEVPADDNEDLEDTLATTEYTVVGVVHDATYFSFEREPASVGSGAVETIFYILPQDFAYESYTEIYLTVDGALAMNSMGDAYEKAVQTVSDEVEEIAGARCEARLQEVKSDAQQEIDDAWDEYNESAAEAEEELSDAAQELEDGRQALADGEQKVADGERDYQDGLAELSDYEQQLKDGEAALNSGMAELISGQAQWQENWQKAKDGETALAEGKKQLEEAQRQYEEGKAAYDAALAKIEAGEAALAENKTKLDTAQAQYDQLAEFNQGLNEYKGGLQQYTDGVNYALAQYTATLPYPVTITVTTDQMEEILQELSRLEADQWPTDDTRMLLYIVNKVTGGLVPPVDPGGEVVPEPETEEPEQPDPAQVVTEEPSAPAADTTDGQDGTAAPASDEIPVPETGSASVDNTPADPPETTAEETAPDGNTEPETADTAASEPSAAAEDPAEQVPSVPEDTLSLPAPEPASADAETTETDSQQRSVRENPDPSLPGQGGGETLSLVDGAKELIDGKAKIESGIQLLILTYQQQGQQLTEEEAYALISDENVASVKAQLDDGWAQYDAGAAQLAEGRSQLEANEQTLIDGKAQLDAGWAQYEAQGTELYDGLNQLRSAKTTLDEGWDLLLDKQMELDDARKEIEDARATLADAKQELEDARQTIAEKAQELRDGEIEYADAKAEADQKLADARAEIEDAEAKLNDIEEGEWYVWDRGRNVSYASFDSNSTKLAALAKVFPVFFFLVAALVVSTTMTRMVEEERLQIGTMKALGYTSGAIMQKYLLYALTAAAAGAVFGLMLGFFVFPRVIWTAYQMMYYAPAFLSPWRWDVGLLAGGSLIAIAMAATWSACRATLHEYPAALMRPRAPKAGKRILLERVTFLWRRLPFTYKVTCRNLLRYKKRFWMTVIGVAGCTALLVTGFGISDSLNSIVTKQFGEIYHYDLLTAVTDAEYTREGPAYEYLYHDDAVKSSLTVFTQQVEQELEDGSTVDYYYMVPEDVERFADFADLHNRQTGDATPLGQEGVVLTEKLASTLDVKPGDTVTLEDADGNQAQFTVTGVCEHYVYNYVYMSAASYEQGFGHEPDWNAVMSQLTDTSQQGRDAVSAALLAMDEVASLNFTADSMAMVLNMLESIDAVVVLIIVCAACLAFVVLYNLTNINIAERVKEIATIKVLGFYDREVDAYVNRESVILTLIGAFFGLAGGVALHKFVILTVEVDAVMFGRDIQPLSFVYALALTFLFSLFVNLVMGRKLKHISMVESMKAPE